MKQKLTLTTLLVLLSAFYLQAQTSKVNVTIDGPGVVDEYYLLGADGSKQLKLKAVPSKFLGDVTFDGWSGDTTGTATELTVAADKAQNIHAKFTYHRPVKKYPLLNLKQSWADMGKPLYYEMPPIWESEDQYNWRGHSYLPVDYNRDGYLDYVKFPMKGGMGTDNHRENVRFWLGKSDGTFEEDPLNDNRMVGTVYSIHIKYADLNNDGYPDFCSFSTGYDREGSTYDYPVILMSSPDGVYKDLRFEDWGNFCIHGGEVGDIDNDGDIDVVFLDIIVEGIYDKSLLLINDGKGNFTRKALSEIVDFSELKKRYSSPDQLAIHGDLNIIDLNNDGYNDLVFTGSDVFDSDGSNYASAPVVMWGSSTGKFGGTNYSLFPKCRLGYSINEDMAFYDLNGDGVKEVIIERCGDGQLGGTRFYRSGYLQVCEWDNGEYVDKTEHYIPVEHKAFNKEASEVAMWIENLDGTDYILTAGNEFLYPGLSTGVSKVYAIRNGKLESMEAELKTKVSSFDEGLPIYVDAPWLTDVVNCGDGVNPVDTMAAHQWVGISDWDSTTGNMWRINLHHRKDTHFGRTCIRWNRDGQDPNKQLEWQTVTFGFVSEVDIKNLADAGYYLECYIKNTDPELTLRLGFEWHGPDFQPDSFRGRYAELSKKYVEGGVFTGEWQRVQIPLSAFVGNGDMSGFLDFVIKADKGDLKNEFYLDDIRIRKLPDSGINDYDRAFMMDYLNKSYMAKERTKQVNSQEFKAMLKPLIQQFASDSIGYFNRYITDYDVPLTRGMATCMAYYVARSIGAETGNAQVGEQAKDIWNATFTNYDKLLPHCQDPGEEDAPEDKFWRGTVFGGWMTAFYWNFCHTSDHSGINVIALDKEANEFHWDQAFTWEDAVCAITRLLDSIDPNIVQEALVPVTVTAKSYTIKYGDALPKFEYTSEGATLKGTPEITCEATGQSPAGTYPIVITRGSITNYNVTFINGTLTVEPIEIKPISESEEMSFKDAIGNETDLENTVIDNTYYNMDATNGDGYDATEQALVLNSTTSSAQMSAVQGAQVGDAAVRENFSGIIFEIPAGQGVITVDAKTIGTHVLNVQIGNGAPTQVKKSERGTVEVEYNVSAPTYVYLYASTESGASARLYRGPSAGANSVLLYGYKVQVGGTGIEELKNGKMEELKYYDLNGRKVKTPRKGVYIINGKKVVVK